MYESAEVCLEVVYINLLSITLERRRVKSPVYMAQVNNHLRGYTFLSGDYEKT